MTDVPRGADMPPRRGRWGRRPTKDPKYTPEQRAVAVARSYEIGIRQAALEKGIPENTVGAWRQKARDAGEPILSAAKAGQARRHGDGKP